MYARFPVGLPSSPSEILGTRSTPTTRSCTRPGGLRARIPLNSRAHGRESLAVSRT